MNNFYKIVKIPEKTILICLGLIEEFNKDPPNKFFHYKLRNKISKTFFLNKKLIYSKKTILHNSFLLRNFISGCNANTDLYIIIIMCNNKR